MIVKKQYRIVKRPNGNYEAQKRVCYFPFWFIIGTKTIFSEAQAYYVIEKDRGKHKEKRKEVETFDWE